MKRIGAILLLLSLHGCAAAEARPLPPADRQKTCPDGTRIPIKKTCPTVSAPSFTVAGVTVSEADGTAMLHISRTGSSTASSTISYTTANNTATAGTDYNSANGTLTFATTDTSKMISVGIVNDAIVESTETFLVNFSAGNGTITPSATVTITDEDSPPGDGDDLIPDIADNFDTSSWLIAGEGPHTSPDQVGAFRFTCLGGHLLKDDPLVYPGQAGASHLHQFFGNTDTNANSTYTSLRTVGGSTCTRSATESVQRTAYWMPAMLDGAGNAVKADWMNTYYKQLPATDPDCLKTTDPLVAGSCVALPNGLRFILGYNMSTNTGGPSDTNSRDYYAMGFDCDSKASGGGASYTGIKHTLAEIVATGKCPVGEWLRVYLTFPDCWDGKNLDSANHRTHVSFGAPVYCPATHKYKFPEVAIQAFFTTDANFAAGKWHLSSDEMLSGFVVGPASPVPAGKSLHMDYFEAWSRTFKDLFETNCINGHLSCSSGSLGDFTAIKGMQQSGAFPNHVLVPLSSIP